MHTDGTPSPVLIYDAGNPFWPYWIRYWQRLTGAGVRYEAYDETPTAEPRPLQWIDPDGSRQRGAAAAFRLQAATPGGGFWWQIYRQLPGFAWLAEVAFRLPGNHPRLALAVARCCWGNERHPASHALTSWLFLRLLALIYLAAFVSLATQVSGLVGSEGILPAEPWLEQRFQSSGWLAYLETPTLFWLDASDRALNLACILGIAAAAGALLNLLPTLNLLLCCLLYLSLVHAGQRFFEFQWDLFLLESGFLALFLGGGTRIVVWLYRWLLFRFMLMGGIVKLASGDPSWRDLSALRHHLETQPLPSPLAWHAYQLPDSVLESATAAVLFIELVVPFCVLLPRRPRLFAAYCFLVLQGGILLTGNFAFFNLLTLILCLFLLEDRDLLPILGTPLATRIAATASRRGRCPRALAAALAGFALSACAALLWATAAPPAPALVVGLARMATNLGIVNGYGPFAVVSRERLEIVVEGSDDCSHWLPYSFRYKPGDPAAALGWNVPHQPRLDWQMWFATLNPGREKAWFCAFLERLRGHSGPVLALLQDNPFPARPPLYLRAELYRYRFSTPAQRAAAGAVWQRQRVGGYGSEECAPSSPRPLPKITAAE